MSKNRPLSHLVARYVKNKLLTSKTTYYKIINKSRTYKRGGVLIVSELLTVKEAAALLHVKERTVLGYLKTGELEGV